MSAGHDKKIVLWNPYKNMAIQEYKGHGYDITDVAIHKDNTKFVSGSADKCVFLWDVAPNVSGPVRKWKEHSGRIEQVCFNTQYSVVLSCSYDKTVKMWDLLSPSRLPIQSLQDSKDTVTSIDVYGHEIVAGGMDGHTRVYDIRMGKCIVDSWDQSITFCKFILHSKCILAATLNHQMAVMDKLDSEILIRYKGHSNDKYKLRGCLSPLDKFVLLGSEEPISSTQVKPSASSSYTKSVEQFELLIWNVLEEKEVKRVPTTHTQPIVCIDYHPKEDMFVTCSHDNTIQLFGTKK